MKKLSPQDLDAWGRANLGTIVWKKGETLPVPKPLVKSFNRQERLWERAHLEQQLLAPNYGVDRLLPRKAKSIVIEATLDLHGDTRAQAQEHLFQFLYRSQLLGKRWVRVITGKSGVLRQDVPGWLKENSPLVSGYTQAPDFDGGCGALYVRVRWGKTL